MKYAATADLLTQILPTNHVATRSWLLANGLSKDRLDNHVKSGRLRKLARGVYCHYYAILSWQSVAASLGHSVPVAAYVGGLSALQEYGLNQYLNISNMRLVVLYSAQPKPRWLSQLDQQLASVTLDWHKAQRLWPSLSSTTLDDQLGIVRSASAESFMLATPERAFLELLEEVPKTISFEHADELMQGLVNLSPRRLQQLIKCCHSVKVKRLFCWFAERHQHTWWQKLAVDTFDLGAGKRVVQQGGRLDKRYQITVPAHMHRVYETHKGGKW